MASPSVLRESWRIEGLAQGATRDEEPRCGLAPRFWAQLAPGNSAAGSHSIPPGTEAAAGAAALAGGRRGGRPRRPSALPGVDEARRLGRLCSSGARGPTRETRRVCRRQKVNCLGKQGFVLREGISLGRNSLLQARGPTNSVVSMRE